MMRSLYSGVAGLKTHQVKMDVIGNNIANVNTTSYKASSIVFSELMSQTTQRASGPNATSGIGGTNARQIGLGVKSGAININITGQGSSQSTGNPFDVMITGENFFVVSNGRENFFTRDGSFYVDGAGNLAMTSTGYNVMGWGVDEETGNIKQDTVAALRIMSQVNMTYPPEYTTQAHITGILDKNDTDVTSTNGKVVNLNFYDNLGYEYTAKFVFKQSAAKNEYSLEFSKLLDSTGKEVELTDEQKQKILGGGVEQTQKKNATIKLNDSYKWSGTDLTANNETLVYATGDATNPYSTMDPKSADYTSLSAEEKAADYQKALAQIAKAYGYEGSVNEFLNMKIPVTLNAGGSDTTAEENYSIKDIIENKGGNLPALHEEAALGEGKDSPERVFYGYKLVFNPDNGDMQSVDGSMTSFMAYFNLADAGEGFSNFSNIQIDLSTISMVDNKGTSTVGADKGNLDGLGTGRRLGDMIGVSIQRDGMIYASYDNGMTRLLGQIATASFANASGLEKKGDNLYSATLNSGEFDGIGVDITANGGYMSTGQLEMSNVDLSSEFTEMITTQRGFQANSRIITVSDTLLEELTNLKR